MPANIDVQEMFKQKEIQESNNCDYPFIGGADHIESEIQWVELHKMFDR